MKRFGWFGRFRRSLLSRYLLIILSAFLFLPLFFPVSYMVYSLAVGVVWNDLPSAREANPLYPSGKELELAWHREALALSGKSAPQVDARLEQLARKYADAELFWVDAAGRTRRHMVPDPKPAAPAEPASTGLSLPEQWTASDAVMFMKDSYNSDPFTAVAFIGDRPDAGQGFMAIRVSRSLIGVEPAMNTAPNSFYFAVFFVMFVMFVAVSWLFFAHIRRRLTRLQQAMTLTGEDGIPEKIPGGRPDEIGLLEESFNTMVGQLADSRRREREEEELRKRLVADLSHDLRTPLTVIRSHVHSLHKEGLSERGEKSLALMDERIADLGGLIDNLLSYNLLSSGRIKLSLESREMLRLMRESVAAWYPVWEKEGFEIDIDLEGEPFYWQIDVIWFRRILDNFYQNIVRHAGSGRYVGIRLTETGGRRGIVVSDRGPGMQHTSEAKGAGLGLAIVDVLISRMDLHWSVDSGPEGTAITLTGPAVSSPVVSEMSSSGNLNKI